MHAKLASAVAGFVLLTSLPAFADTTLDLVGPIADYKVYVSEKLSQLKTDTAAFTAAIRAGDVAKAKALFAPTRLSYEAVEPIAELFSDLDAAIDSRADDHEKAEADPGFTGFHRIEYVLWEKNTTDGLTPFVDKLDADVTELDSRVAGLALPPEKVVFAASSDSAPVSRGCWASRSQRIGCSSVRRGVLTRIVPYSSLSKPVERLLRVIALSRHSPLPFTSQRACIGVKCPSPQ